jgi:hypothetical protein
MISPKVPNDANPYLESTTIAAMSHSNGSKDNKYGLKSKLIK